MMHCPVLLVVLYQCFFYSFDYSFTKTHKTFVNVSSIQKKTDDKALLFFKLLVMLVTTTMQTFNLYSVLRGGNSKLHCPLVTRGGTLQEDGFVLYLLIVTTAVVPIITWQMPFLTKPRLVWGLGGIKPGIFWSKAMSKYNIFLFQKVTIRVKRIK